MVSEYKIAKEIFSLGKDILLSEEAGRMKKFTQHGTTTVFEHCVSVAKYSLIFAMNLETLFGIKLDRRSLVRGALLHDYFLYDWHEKDNGAHRLHGFTHPGRAFENAARDFDMNDKERDVIRKHMFPLTPVPPRFLESALVCIADKWCALCETFKVDISSYIIYRVNMYRALASGDIKAIKGQAVASVEA
ncbi:MAG: HD domain-containing protein [Clostridiales bacterium]|nr:HD domain-containing protein [Clostridiales bacterium]